MKNLSYFLTIFLITLIGYSCQLSAQTYKERVRSAELLSQIMPGQLKITADNVSRITQKDLRATIESADYAPDYEAALMEELSLLKPVDWRGMMMEFTDACNSIFYVYIIDTERQEALVYAFFPPDNKCEAAYLSLAAVGLVDPFYVPLNVYEEYTVCVSKLCMPNDKGSCCFDVIYKVPEGKECPPAECTVSSCDCSIKITPEIWDDIYMDK